jgi:dephospho-CoA kinase
MVTIGLTGGIASGKSTVSAEFGKLGALVIDADQIARELIRPHKRTWRNIITSFGREILRDDLTIDREKLAAKVFSDEAHRETLNRIMHPAIKREIRRRREGIEGEDPNALVLVDAALLVETEIFREMDKLIVVSVSEENQIRRLVDRSGLSVEEAKRRIRVQMPLKEKLKHADYVINTDGPLGEIRKQVRGIYGELMTAKE